MVKLDNHGKSFGVVNSYYEQEKSGSVGYFYPKLAVYFRGVSDDHPDSWWLIKKRYLEDHHGSKPIGIIICLLYPGFSKSSLWL